jgi:hypothetical protein
VVEKWIERERRRRGEAKKEAHGKTETNDK